VLTIFFSLDLVFVTNSLLNTD